MTMNSKETNMSSTRLFPLSLIALAVLAACSTAPTQQLLEARSSYAAAQNDPQVVEFAGSELIQAGAQLKQAELSASKGESKAQVDQLAYITKQRVTIARETARQKSAELTTAGAAAEREKIRLAARTAEADAAQRAAAASKLDAEASQRQSESSQRQAQDAEARSRQLEIQLKELDAKKTERGMVITLGDVLFDTNKSELKSGGMRNVQKLAGVLKEYPQRNVLVEGFTDSTGNSDYNQGLSERRAGAVRTALQDTGVAGDRISNRGYGQTFPVASNATAEGRQLNRRVEIIVSDDGKAIAPR
jgi:outer membrane protein OmpA-like peptidoglycan-associated protein